MYKNILKSALRNIAKNRLFSFMSVLGLSLAIGCFTVSFIFVDFWNSMDSFHENVDEIFLAEIVIDRSGDAQTWGPTPIPLGPALKEDFPHIKNYVRMKPRGGIFSYDDKVFEEEFLFVDDEFLDMFTFPMVAGNTDALRDKSAIVMSQRYAEKYFGDESPIGKEISVSHGDEYKQSFFVKGVVENVPENSSIQFDILLPYERVLDWDVENLNDWSLWTHTFIQLVYPKDIDIIRSGMEKYIRLQNAANVDWPVTSFLFEPFSDVSRNSYKVDNDIGRGTNPTSKVVLSMFGIFLLLLACFNYVNIGIVTATRRLKEIGIRKVLGSSKIKLVVQFLGENILLCLIAVVIGTLLAELCLLPSFNSMFGAPLKMNFSDNYRLWLFFGVTLITTCAGSGGYPALYVSRFIPIDILRRTQKVGGGSIFVKVLLTFQFVLTFLLIGSALIFVKNAKYQKNIDWGYNKDQVIGVRLDGEKHFEIFRNAIAQNPNIVAIAGSKDHIGTSSDIDVVEIKGRKYEICRFLVGHDYLQTMQLRLKEGRLFDRSLVTDLDGSIVINEKFARNMNWVQAVGQSVVIDSTVYNVIGVIENFHYEPFIDPIEPTLFRLCEKDEFDFISIRANTGTVNQTSEYVKETWNTLIPDEQYKEFFQDQIWDSYFRETVSIYTLTIFVACVALGISCMGLFGLISVSVVKRMKELSIRKVLGASIASIARLLTKDLVKILILSSIIAAPLCLLLMNQILNVYEYHAPISIFQLIVTGTLMTFISLVTVFSQIAKAARSNPVDTLSSE